MRTKRPNRLFRSAPYLLRKLRRESLIRGAVWAQTIPLLMFANSRVFRVLEFSSVSPFHGDNRKRLRLLTSLCSVGLQALREDAVPMGLHFLVEHLRREAISQPEARNTTEGALSFFITLRLFFISLDKGRSSILAEKSNNAKIKNFTII